MGKSHLKRIAAPKTWDVRRKTNKFIARPMPGPHSLKASLTINFLLRNVLQCAKTTKEIKLILANNSILIDKKSRKEYKYPVGFMDVVELPSTKEYYRMLYNHKGKLKLINIDSKESKLKLLKVINKSIIKKGKIQITFHDGRNMLLDKFDGKVGDTALFDLEKKEIKKWIPLAENSLIYLSGGGYVGSVAKIKGIIKARDLQKEKVVVEIEGKEYITLSDYAFVIGKDKSELKVQEK